MIINLGCASVDNHIPRNDIFDSNTLRECNTRDVRKELPISIWRLQISSNPKSAHSMPSKNSPWLEMQSFNRCIHFLKASRYTDLGTVIRY